MPRLTLVRVATDDHTVDINEIDAQSGTAGATLVSWFGNEVRRVRATFSESEDARERRMLDELIRRKGGSVTARDVMRSSRKYATAAEAEGRPG